MVGVATEPVVREGGGRDIVMVRDEGGRSQWSVGFVREFVGCS